MTNNTEILRTEGLKRSYLVNETKIDVLKGINLTINNQEFIAIMGKSGSGKTTLLKLLGLLDRPTEGKVFFKGEDSNSLRGDRLAMIRRREIGFIYQDYYLMDSLSVRENIMLPKILDHSPVEESITEAEKLADIMGVRALLDKKIFELSGGEKQRAAICRALMNHSDLILADEPTGNLDSASSETVMEYLQMINKDLKKAVVLVTHDAYVASFCDRVIFVKDGNIEVELRKKEKQDVSEKAEALKIRMTGLDQRIIELSGGNQQKAVFAKALMTNPKVFLCDEPTQAVDIMTRNEIHKLLREKADAGNAVVYVSSDLKEILEVADTIQLVVQGETRQLLVNENLTTTEVLSYCYE